MWINMNIDFSIDEDAGEVNIIFDNQISLKVIKTGDDFQDFTFSNFHRVDDDNVAQLIKSFARSVLLL
jgi:hypothetical protein